MPLDRIAALATFVRVILHAVLHDPQATLFGEGQGVAEACATAAMRTGWVAIASVFAYVLAHSPILPRSRVKSLGVGGTAVGCSNTSEQYRMIPSDKTHGAWQTGQLLPLGGHGHIDHVGVIVSCSLIPQS